MDDQILIVERNEACRKLLSYLLRARGLRPIAVRDTTAGLAALADATPSLVLLDLVLTDPAGLAFVGRMSGLGIPAIAVTGCAMVGDRMRALDAGCVGYIAKPIDTRTFASLVMREMRGRPIPPVVS